MQSYFTITKSEDSTTEIYEDPAIATSFAELKTTADAQTEGSACDCSCRVTSETAEAEELAHKLMEQDEIPEEYWEAIAERRKTALDETSKENEQLHQKICQKREEKEALMKVTEDTEYFANLLNDCLSSTDAAESNEADDHHDCCRDMKQSSVEDLKQN